MQVVLLEKVGTLGQIGDVVDVKSGYARNYLLPQAKALRATKTNMAVFEAQKAQLVKDNEKRKADAEKAAKKVDGKTCVIIRAASEGGQLYGSVSTRDIAEAVSSLGETVDRTQVNVNQSFKTLGLFDVEIALHPEVLTTVTVNIARSEDEAAIQEKEGRALVAKNEQVDETPVVEETVAVEETTQETEEKTEDAA